MFKSATLTAKLLILVGAFAGCFVAYSALVFRTVESVRVNGPVYEAIVRGKDLIADVLPPPAYVIEAYLMALQLNEEPAGARFDRLVERGEKLRAEFESRHLHWERVLPPGPTKDAFRSGTYKPGVDFFSLRDTAFLPALRAGDHAGAQAVLKRMQERYEAHRLAVDEVVRLAGAQNSAAEQAAENLVQRDSALLLAFGVMIFAVVLLLAWFAARTATGLTRQIRLAAGLAQRVASGDLSAVLQPEEMAGRTDEAGKLLQAIDGMTRSLRGLVAQAKVASVEILSSATEFAASSRQQEATVSGFAASTNQIDQAVKAIGDTSGNLQSTMAEISGLATETAGLAEEGRAGLLNLDETMERLAKTASVMASRLADIRAEAEEITGVVTTISKVADQTNLLSINAAIEAERAGEQGLGFLVLAREIRRLADQTAVATLDIEDTVKQMQAAVSAGVMEIDRFAEEVSTGIRGVERVGGRFSQIISQVKSLSDSFGSVNNGMRGQTQDAHRIADAMGALVDGARQTNSSLQEFNAATEMLRDAIGGLKQQIAQFKVE